MNKNPEHIMTVAETAEYLGLTEASLRMRMKRGTCPVFGLTAAGTYGFRASDCDTWKLRKNIGASVKAGVEMRKAAKAANTAKPDTVPSLSRIDDGIDPDTGQPFTEAEIEAEQRRMKEAEERLTPSEAAAVEAYYEACRIRTEELHSAKHWAYRSDLIR